jgi:endoglucanase
MDDSARQFLETLLRTPSPSGSEARIQKVVKEYAASFSDSIHLDRHGNLVAGINPNADTRIIFCGHCDQIGLIVSYIDSDGFISVQQIGGWDPQILLGQRVSIWTNDGEIPGVIARKPIHLLTDEERKSVPKIQDLWIDIGAADRTEVESLVRVGDSVTVALDGMRELRNGFAISPAMDDKTGLWVVIEGLRRAKQRGATAAVFAASTVAEEIGLRGAQTATFGVDPHIGIAVDVTHATDCPTIDKKQNGDVRLGRGPVIYRGPNMNPKVAERLIEIAKSQEMPYQLAAIGRACPNDANAIQVSRAGVATGLVSLANRYMHSPVEMISLTDIDQAADLLAQFVTDIGSPDDFIP